MEEVRRGEGEGLQRDLRKLRGDRDVHYLDCGDDFMSVYICQNLSNYILVSAVYCMQFHLNKTVFKNLKEHEKFIFYPIGLAKITKNDNGN